MNEQMKSAIIATVIASIFSLVVICFSWWWQQQNSERIATLNKEVFQPCIIIKSPDKDEEVEWILPAIKGTVKGGMPGGYKILAGHRGIMEQKIKMHADRYSDVLSDKSFMVDRIYLGSQSQGVGETFEIIVLLVSDETLDSLNLKDGDNPLGHMPEHIAKSVTRVTRVR